jgi:hypothetical protein
MIAVNNGSAIPNPVAAITAAVANQIQPFPDLFQSYIYHQPLANQVAILPYGRQPQIVGLGGQQAYMPISFVDPQLVTAATGSNVNQAAAAWQAALNAAAVAQHQHPNLFAQPHVQPQASLLPNNFLHDQMARFLGGAQSNYIRQQPHGQSFFDVMDVSSASMQNNSTAYALNPIALFMASNPTYIAPNNPAIFPARQRQPANVASTFAAPQKSVYVPPQRQATRASVATTNSHEDPTMRSSTENDPVQAPQHPVFIPQISLPQNAMFMPDIGMLIQQQNPYYFSDQSNNF